MNKILFGFYFVFNLLASSKTLASPVKWPITCHCERAGQTWVIEHNKITIKPSDESASTRFRSIASGPHEIWSVRTHQTAEGMSKVVTLNGQQMTWGHNANDTYLTIRSPEGHEVIYPMDCK